MLRRFTAFFLAVCFSLALVIVAVPARAAGNTDLLIASAVMSFLSSAGVHLWRDFSGAYDEDEVSINMRSDIKQLWHYYTDYNPSTTSFDNLLDGISVHDGNWIYNYDTALTLQSFTNWLAEYRLSKTPGEEFELDGFSSIPSSSSTLESSSGFTLYQFDFDTKITLAGGGFRYISLVPVGVRTSSPYELVYCGVSGSSSVGYVSFYSTNNPFTSEFVLNHSTHNGSCAFVYQDSSGDWRLSDTATSIHVSPEISSFSKSFHFIPYEQFRSPVAFSSGITLDNMTSSGSDGATGLLGSIGSNVVDQTFNLVKPKVDEQTGEVISPGQDLAISVGAATDADADDLIADALARYIAQTETDALTEPIAHPVPIEGESIAYPQPVTDDIVVDGQSLTFSDLGPMLTSRFPFCIPWDLADLFNTLVVPAKPINTRIDIVPQAWRAKYHITGDTSFQLDLTTDNWILLRKIIAWGFLFGACGELILLTKSAIWTA